MEMELKAEHVCLIKDPHCLAYPKNETDKYIESLKNTIEHHKYKRCMSMANYCEERTTIMFSGWVDHINDSCENIAGYYYTKEQFFIRWRDRWLKLANAIKAGMYEK